MCRRLVSGVLAVGIDVDERFDDRCELVHQVVFDLLGDGVADRNGRIRVN